MYRSNNKPKFRMKLTRVLLIPVLYTESVHVWAALPAVGSVKRSVRDLQCEFREKNAAAARATRLCKMESELPRAIRGAVRSALQTDARGPARPSRPAPPRQAARARRHGHAAGAPPARRRRHACLAGARGPSPVRPPCARGRPPRPPARARVLRAEGQRRERGRREQGGGREEGGREIERGRREGERRAGGR